MRTLIAGLAAVALSGRGRPDAQPQPAPAQRPNIVFIMTDDHAAHAISAYGSKVNQTPHLDRLAKEGALFTNVFATNSICTPSRAAILTGQYSHLNGVTMFNRFDSSRMTVARLLQQAGYHTGMVGKWHLGSDPRGFDRWEIFPGQGDYVDPVLYTATGEKKYTGRYATDVVTDLALDFIATRPDGQAVLPDAAPQGAAPAVDAERRAWRRSSRRRRSPSRRRCGTTTRGAPTPCTRTSSASPT